MIAVGDFKTTKSFRTIVAKRLNIDYYHQLSDWWYFYTIFKGEFDE